ncbi:MAG: hypothetical protein EA405_04600 [Rhodospirillales bacterium]|nr:MAG: hypothetical protein EA405_04600 [Rhodospirillales bacterium]
MDAHGRPIRLFTTNRWVTGEVWYRAEDVIRMLDHFWMDLAYPSLPTNIWISAMVRLFRPEIEDLIRARDRAVADHARVAGSAAAFEDRALEIASALEITVDRQMTRVQAALQRADGG